jgi:hexosaminidase
MMQTSLTTQKNVIFSIRGVHLDLKGVPPTPSRLLQLPRIYAAAGYNAILVEWEDMFCWSVDERFRNETAYSPEDIQKFVLSAQDNGLEIIPLVQCLGHMETPLSINDYAHLREVPYRSDVLNPLAAGARELVEKMIEDILSHIGNIRYFHIGGDEAWSFGTNPQTQAYIAEYGKGRLYLNHIEPILNKLNGRGIRPILWHDMMCEWDDAALRDIGKKADLMVWCYGEPHMKMPQVHQSKILERFGNSGITMWGATAYKGADYENFDLPVIERRQENALDWAETAKKSDFVGIVATGWSRFSTHRVQSEPIDAALDSLFLIGAILRDGALPDKGIDDCIAALDRIGEKERFIQCKSAMEELREGRSCGWQVVSHLREQIVMSTMDSRRRGSGVCLDIIASLKHNLAILEQTALNIQQAFAGLIEPIWLERYLAERILPLYEELQILEPRIRQLEPGAWKAESKYQQKIVQRLCC